MKLISVLFILFAVILNGIDKNETNAQYNENAYQNWEFKPYSIPSWDFSQTLPNWDFTQDQTSISLLGGSLFENGYKWTIRNEGFKKRGNRYICYNDSRGYLTCGIGICVAAKCGGVRKLYVSGFKLDNCWRTCGLTIAHSKALFKKHYNQAYNKLKKKFWFTRLNVNQKIVILDMAYNMGVDVFLQGYKRYWGSTVSVIANRQYRRFTNILRTYPYCKQVGNRCLRNVRLFHS